jgi:hypothetical protein
MCKILKILVFGQVHMCWYVSSAEKRENLPFNINDLDSSLCSHLIYSYSIIDPDTLNLSFLPYEDVSYFESHLVLIKNKIL